MNDRQQRFLAFYQAHRFEEQKTFYQNRAAEFRTAHRQSLWLTFGLSILTALAAGLASSNLLGPASLWKVLAIVFPLLSTTLSAYMAMYAFDRQAKLYQDALNALIKAQAEAPDTEVAGDDLAQGPAVAQYVARIEEILTRENNQWGQLVSQIKSYERPPAEGEKPPRQA
jgi:hypothetical protein